MRELIEGLRKICKLNLNEDPSRIEDDLKYLKEWILQQPHLNAEIDDQWLVGFLRRAKFCLQETTEMIDRYYTIKTLAPEYYLNRDPLLPEIQEALQFGCFFPLPKPNGLERVLIVRLIRSFPAFVKVVSMSLEILFKEDDNFVVAGLRAVEDLQEVDDDAAKNFDAFTMRKAKVCLAEAIPMDIKMVHFVNSSEKNETFSEMYRNSCNKDLVKVFRYHSQGNISEVYKFIDREILPDEYGGTAGSVSKFAAEWKKKIESYRDWFLNDSQYCTDENKRINKPKTVDDIFGPETDYN